MKLSSEWNKTEGNFKQFIDRHGDEGFLTLLITNYLFELAQYYLHTDKNKSSQIREDTSYRFYVDDKERVYPPETIEQLKLDLKKECQKKAVNVVKYLKERNLIKKLATGKLDDLETLALLDDAFGNIVRGSR
jgi:hypothetical protein